MKIGVAYKDRYYNQWLLYQEYYATTDDNYHDHYISGMIQLMIIGHELAKAFGKLASFTFHIFASSATPRDDPIAARWSLESLCGFPLGTKIYMIMHNMNLN